MNGLDDEAIDRALAVWREEGDVAYSARVNDYLHEWQDEAGREVALDGLRLADEQAWAKNRDLMRRAISAALEASTA